MALRIPSKNLEDKFKLDDFQKDFLELLSLMQQPKTINVYNGNEMEFNYSNGNSVRFKFFKTNNKISKVVNLTTGEEVNIYNY